MVPRPFAVFRAVISPDLRCRHAAAIGPAFAGRGEPLLALEERHPRQTTREFVKHYHSERNHRALGTS